MRLFRGIVIYPHAARQMPGNFNAAHNMRARKGTPLSFIKPASAAGCAFFAPPGIYPPAGMYSPAHFIFLSFSVLAITISLVLLMRVKKPSVLLRKINKRLTVLLWVLEIDKIAFNLAIGNGDNPNTYVPFYYCSLVLYAGIMSSFFHGRIRHAGDVFLCTGSIVGGVCFLLMPLTSLPNYPAIHFISFHSILLHTVMVFMGLALLITGSVRLCLCDIIPYGIIVLAVCAAALAVNIPCGSNLMFISRNFPGTPIELIYNACPGILFPIVMCLGQATLPFLAVYLLLPSKCRLKKKNCAKKRKSA